MVKNKIKHKMKCSRILLLSAVTATLLFTGCGAKESPTPAPVETESIEIAETDTEPDENMTAVTNADRGNATAEVNTENTVVDEGSNPLKDGIIKEEDGTYSYTPEFINTISSYEYFEGANQNQILASLNSMAERLIGSSPEEIDELYRSLGNVGERATVLFKHLADDYQAESIPDQSVQTQSSDSESTYSSGNNNSGSQQQNNNSHEADIIDISQFDDPNFGGDGSSSGDFGLVLH